MHEDCSFCIGFGLPIAKTVLFFPYGYFGVESGMRKSSSIGSLISCSY